MGMFLLSTTVPGVVVVDGSQSQTWIHVLCPLPFSTIILQAACLIVLENRMRESLSDRNGSSPIGSLLVDPGCINRYNINKFKSIKPSRYKMIQIFFFFFCVLQAECDELAQREDVLNGENASLRAEINKLKSQYEELLAENSSL